MSNVLEINVANIQRNPLNPSTRTPDKELIQSIKQYGIINPLLLKTNGSKDTYVLVAGERRYQAALEIGMQIVPGIVLDEQSKEQSDTLLIVDNLHRKNLNVYEEFQIIKQLSETHNVKEIAKALNKPTKWVYQRLSLERLHPSIVKDVQDGAIVSSRALFIFAQLPKTIQANLREDYIEAVEMNGRNVIVYSDSGRIQDAAERAVRDEFFDMPAEQLATLLNDDELGKVGMDKIMDGLFDDNKTDAPAQQTKQEISAKVKQVKEFREACKDSQPLSVSNWHSNALIKEFWRAPNKGDDPATIKIGILVDGDNAGTFQKFVQIDPKKIKAEQTKKAKESRTPEEVEKARKERRDKILTNKAMGRALDVVATSVLGLPQDYSLNELILTGFLDRGTLREMLSAILSDEEFSHVSFKNTYEIAAKTFGNISPAHFLYVYALLPHVTTYDVADVCKFTKTDWKAILKQAKKDVVTELEEAKARKLAEKNKK